VAFNEFEIENDEAKRLLQDIGVRLLAATKDSGFGFTLLVFSYNGPEMFYASSANREDMCKAMQEFIDKYGTKKQVN